MTITGLLTVLALTVVLLLFLRDNYTSILSAMENLSVWGLLLLLCAGFLYQLAEAAVCRTMVRTRLPRFSILKALKVTFFNFFGDVASFGAISVPLQSYSLYISGLAPGAGVGLMTLEYVFHKLSILLYASVMLALQWRWLRQTLPTVTRYLLPAYLVISLIIVALVLLCTWRKVQQLAAWVIRRLPDTEKWSKRKEKYQTQLEAVYTESRLLFQNKLCCVKIILINAVKLFILYSIPYLCVQLLGIAGPSFFQMQLLASLMLFLTNVMVNIAGMGPTEFAFLLLFSPYVGETAAAAALILYRISTYYWPILLSIFPFSTIRRS